MKFRHRFIRRICVPAIALAVTAALAPAGAVAAPADSVSAKWQSYDEQIAALTPEELAAAFGTDVPTAKVGDTPADFPGASRAPEYNGPSTVAIVRPERTTVRDVDHALPIVLAGLALLIAVGGTGYVLVRMRTMARAGLGSSH
ncbi:MAG TPA: hypothetical protein VKB54_15510 [Solirubrobacteraceae bacterium]|nr:hypothetical protein [Solirubrobacteraceae bacterium]